MRGYKTIWLYLILSCFLLTDTANTEDYDLKINPVELTLWSNLNLMQIKVTSSLGFNVVDAKVRVRKSTYFSGTINFGPWIELTHKGNGLYETILSQSALLTSSNYITGSSPRGYSLEITAPDHSRYYNALLQLGLNRENEVSVFFSNYNKLCNDKVFILSKSASDAFGGFYSNCAFDNSKLIEIFGSINAADYRFSTKAQAALPINSYSHPNRVQLPSIYFNRSNITTLASSQEARVFHYKKIFEELAISNAFLQTNIWAPLSIAEFEKNSYSTFEDLTSTLYTWSFRVGFVGNVASEIFPQLSPFFLAAGGTLVTGESALKSYSEAVVTYYVYQTAMENYLSNLENLISGVQSGEKVLMQRAVSLMKLDFVDNNKLTRDELVQKIRAKETPVDISEALLRQLAGSMIKNGLTNILVNTGVHTTAANSAATAFTLKVAAIIGLKVVVATAVVDFFASSVETSRAIDYITSMALLEQQAFSGFGNSYVPGLSDISRIQNEILHLQLAFLYNTYRSKWLGGEYRTWVGRQWLNSIESAPSQIKAIEFEMIEVSTRNNEIAERAIEMYLDDLLQISKYGNIVEERQKELTLCRDWTVANSGGFEGTIDIWDISTLPENAYFDVRFDMINVPDRILVYYPDTDMKYDSGWRGSPQASSVLNANQLSGSGEDTVLGIFHKKSINHFRIEVIGSESSTQWNYSVRCRASTAVD